MEREEMTIADALRLGWVARHDVIYYCLTCGKPLQWDSGVVRFDCKCHEVKHD